MGARAGEVEAAGDDEGVELVGGVRSPSAASCNLSAP